MDGTTWPVRRGGLCSAPATWQRSDVGTGLGSPVSLQSRPMCWVCMASLFARWMQISWGKLKEDS